MGGLCVKRPRVFALMVVDSASLDLASFGIRPDFVGEFLVDAEALAAV